MTKLQKANNELKAIKEKIRAENVKLHDLEKKVPYVHLINYFRVQKNIITLEKEKEAIKRIIPVIKKGVKHRCYYLDDDDVTCKNCYAQKECLDKGKKK